MSRFLTPLQQSILQKALYDLDELARELLAAGQHLVVTTHPLPASDRYSAAVSTLAVSETFTWQRP